MNKLKMWNAHSDWDEAEKAWDAKAAEAAKKHPIKMLKQMPSMLGITKETAKNLKWKSLRWMISQDHEGQIRKGFFKYPLKYGWALLKSAFKKKPYLREGDFFFYGIRNEEEFKKLLTESDTLLVLGFSYCHKPFECPSGRFTDACIHDLDNPVCQQCFIGKSVHASTNPHIIPLFIPTIHYIGGKIFEIVHNHPNKRVLFIITACEMTLEMFGDWGNMVDIKGIGVRLDGRICNTMKAFELSERGIKPGLTVVLDETQKRILNLLKLFVSKKSQ
jgi:hypothetical protein